MTRLYSSDWVDAHGRVRGQVSSGTRGLFGKLNSARRATAEGTSSRWRITANDTGEVIYDQDAGVDVGPRCTQCPAVCSDPSAHVDAYVTDPATETLADADATVTVVQARLNRHLGTIPAHGHVAEKDLIGDQVVLRSAAPGRAPVYTAFHRVNVSGSWRQATGEMSLAEFTRWGGVEDEHKPPAHVTDSRLERFLDEIVTERQSRRAP